MSGEVPSSYGQAPLTPSSSSTGPSETLIPSAEDAAREDNQRDLPYISNEESSQGVNDLTPLVAVQERPTNSELDDRSHALPSA